MAQYIDKDALVAKIRNKIDSYRGDGIISIGVLKQHCEDFIYSLDTLEVKEVSEELAETYMQVFEKKFPILPTLKGKQLDKFKNFLNRCRQIFGLQESGIHPVQAKLFEKLALLWTAWGAENLQGIGQVKGEPDVVKEVDLEKEIELVKGDYEQVDVAWNNDFDFIARHFFELGLKAKGE